MTIERDIRSLPPELSYANVYAIRGLVARRERNDDVARSWQDPTPGVQCDTRL